MSEPIRFSPALLESITDQLRTCGNNEAECVVYVTAANETPRKADGFIHPRHSRSAVATEVALDDLTRIWTELSATNKRIVCQVHTHPGSAFHSSRDDELPVVHSNGFLSLVLPAFGQTGLVGAHLAVYKGGGRFSSVPGDELSEFFDIADG